MAYGTSRRTVAKGALWTLPAVAVVGSAPALAASCNPASNVVERKIALTFAFTGSVIGPNADASVTYVNGGPDALAAGTVLTFDVVGSYRPEDGEPSVAPVAMPSTTTFTMSGQPDTSYQTTAYRITVRAVLGQELSVGQALAISLNPQGFARVEDLGPDGDYSGGEVVAISVSDDTTNSSQKVVEACQTIREIITITTTE